MAVMHKWLAVAWTTILGMLHFREEPTWQDFFEGYAEDIPAPVHTSTSPVTAPNL